MNKKPPADAPRIVKPRKRAYTHRQIVAITGDAVMVEGKGTFPIEDLPQILCSVPSSILAVQGFGEHLQRLEHVFRGDPAFSYRVTPVYRYLRAKHNGREFTRAAAMTTLCNFVGWRGERKQANRYHYPLDPIHFAQGLLSIDDIDDSDKPRIEKLFDWAVQIREWCHRNQIQPKASAGGLAAQLLKDPRFYPEDRRKAPGVINARAREELPGNYYRLFAERMRRYKGVYLDMSNAHHFAAATIGFPDVNTLHAYGDWASPNPQIFAGPDSPLLKRPGLFRLRINNPTGRTFVPPFMERPGEQNAYVYSNELELIGQHGGHVIGIQAAMVSDDTDRGLSRYAKFAMREIRENPEYKPWLKPTLHAAYGLLAARPVPFETGHYRAKGGEPGEYPMGKHSIPVRIVSRDTAIESKIVNVIHRGMIEAQVRKEVIRFAETMAAQGYEVLAIYADSIFVRDRGKPIRLLDPPWRVAGHLSNLKFHSAVHFTSTSLSRLPGVPRTARERFLEMRALRAEMERIGRLPARPEDLSVRAA